MRSDIKKYSATSMRRRSWATSRWAGSSASARRPPVSGVWKKATACCSRSTCALRTLRRMPIRRVPVVQPDGQPRADGGDPLRLDPSAGAPALWGGYSEYQYLHPTSVIHKVPDRVPSPHAAFALPLSNGIQWTQLDARVGMGDVVVIKARVSKGSAA